MKSEKEAAVYTAEEATLIGIVDKMITAMKQIGGGASYLRKNHGVPNDSLAGVLAGRRRCQEVLVRIQEVLAPGLGAAARAKIAYLIDEEKERAGKALDAWREANPELAAKSRRW